MTQPDAMRHFCVLLSRLAALQHVVALELLEERSVVAIESRAGPKSYANSSQILFPSDGVNKTLTLCKRVPTAVAYLQNG